MYLKDGLSTSQIANELGVSKTYVLDRLCEQGIKKGTGIHSLSNPDLYRLPHSAYGWKIKNRKLIPNNKELQICRLIVKLIRDNGFTYRGVCAELEKRKIKTRKGSSRWGHYTITNIYKKWKDKL